MEKMSPEKANEAAAEWMAEQLSRGHVLGGEGPCLPADIRRSVTELDVPEGCVRVGLRFAEGAAELKRVSFPRSLGVLEGGSFQYCKKLETVDFAPGGRLRRFGGHAAFAPFFECGMVKEIALPDGTEEITHDAFLSMGGLETVVLPASVRDVGPSAFDRCPALQAVVFEGRTDEEVRWMDFYPWNVPNPGATIQAAGGLLAEGDEGGMTPEEARRTLEDAMRLAARDDGGIWSPPPACYPEEDHEIVNDDELDPALLAVEELAVPEGIMEIGIHAFRGCPRLKKVSFPASLRKIGDSAFADCEILEKADLPEGLKELGPGAFENCGALRRMAVPDGVDHVGTDTFSGCSMLEDVRLGDSVEEIWEDAFSNCDALRRLELPTGLTRIGERAFQWCSDLEELTVPRGVEEIGEDAFAFCANLRTVVFEGKSLDEVKTMADYPWGLENPEDQVVAGQLLAEDAEMAGWSRMCRAIRGK